MIVLTANGCTDAEAEVARPQQDQSHRDFLYLNYSHPWKAASRAASRSPIAPGGAFGLASAEVGLGLAGPRAVHAGTPARPRRDRAAAHRAGAGHRSHPFSSHDRFVM
jgi:hypothetical protein